jgi:hypothetical protein
MMNLGIALLLASAAFSHKRHAPLKLECTSCHAGAEKSVRAGMPPSSRCQFCHKSMAKASLQAEYDNLPDYVIFSHARHAKVGCAACHGGVEPPPTFNMKVCVDCHKSRGAKVVCNVCHELGQ